MAEAEQGAVAMTEADIAAQKAQNKAEIAAMRAVSEADMAMARRRLVESAVALALFDGDARPVPDLLRAMQAALDPLGALVEGPVAPVRITALLFLDLVRAGRSIQSALRDSHLRLALFDLYLARVLPPRGRGA